MSELASQDLREWVKGVEALGQLARLRGIHWDLEIGGLLEVILERHRHPPALLFEQIPDAREEMRILCSQLDTIERLALAMGAEPRAGLRDFIQNWRMKVRGLRPVEPELVQQGPVFENCLEEKIDFTSFPIPRWHELDGGRYIGTADLVVTRDPQEGWINAGTYRVMVQGPEKLALYISPGKHGRIHRDKWFAQGKACPVAMSFGHHPLLFIAACTDVPFQVSEFAYAGGILGKPIQLVRGPRTGLPIPAFSEIAIEGEMIPGDLQPEGPFGEWPGYYASSQRPEPVVRVKALYYRRDPILGGEPPLRPSANQGFHRSVLRAALIWNALEDAGVPDVQAVWLHPAAFRFFTIVAIRQRYPGHARQAAVLASQCRAGAYLGRYVVVVDDDIDIYNPDDVIWALATRSDPTESIEIIRRAWSGPLDPIIPQGAKGLNSRALIDATRPYDWRDQFPAVNAVSPELKERLCQKYRSLLGGLLSRSE
ncbi:MAG: UbiD family decarboxylase [Deltaproteobacteria bacterium]|nr:UbiD family decarboxylase [Deltaproteobacteria bacterium]